MAFNGPKTILFIYIRAQTRMHKLYKTIFTMDHNKDKSALDQKIDGMLKS